jgi:hypothetical protein
VLGLGIVLGFRVRFWNRAKTKSRARAKVWAMVRAVLGFGLVLG